MIRILAFMTVPDLSSIYINQVVTKLGLSEAPVYINIGRTAGSQINECFDNVDRMVKREGGERILGWQLWESSYMIEAEIHAIWRTPENEYFDVTPKSIAIPHILFLADSRILLDGYQHDNVRINKTGNGLVDDYIRLAEARFFLMNKGDKAGKTGEISFVGQDAQNWQAINGIMAALEVMLQQGLSKNSPCFCRSGERYKRCHGFNLSYNLSRI